MGATGESGDFKGHLVPAVCFGAYGLFFLLLSLKRSRALAPGQSFCETHVPEKSISLMRRAGLSLIILSSMGIAYEGLGGCLTQYTGYQAQGCFFHQSTHIVLYFAFGSIGLIMLVESWGKLPADSTRACTSLAFLVAYILWNEHALMKDDPTDNRVHTLLAQLNLVTAATFALSVFRPTNLTLYIASYGLMLLQGVYLVTAGVNAGIRKIDLPYVGPVFCFEVLVVTLVIVLIGAFCGSNPKNGRPIHHHELQGNMNGMSLSSSNGGPKVEYDRLQISDHDNDDDEGDHNADRGVSGIRIV